MGIGSYEGHLARLEVEVHAIHHGAQLVVGRGEDGLVDTSNEHIYVHKYLLVLGTYALHCGVAYGAGSRD